MRIVRDFRELNVYELARNAALEVFEVSKNSPKEERYALTDQIRRSSRATKAMLAEAWGRRRYKAAFINKIGEALGEALETQSWLDDCLDCSYITAAQFDKMNANWRSHCRNAGAGDRSRIRLLQTRPEYQLSRVRSAGRGGLIE